MRKRGKLAKTNTKKKRIEIVIQLEIEIIKKKLRANSKN